MMWEVELTGDPADLQMLADTFTDAEIQVAQSGEKYVLRSSRFELLESAVSVRENATELVTALSGSARLVLGAQGEIGVGAWVHRMHPDGRRDTSVVVGPAVLRTRAMPITVVRGTEIQQPADPIATWLPLAMRDPAVAKALRLRDAENLGWVDLYRLYEVILSDVGHMMYERGWANQKELERFTRSANSVAAAGDQARHGIERTEPPPKPLSITHARELIDRILKAWLEWKASRKQDGAFNKNVPESK